MSKTPLFDFPIRSILIMRGSAKYIKRQQIPTENAGTASSTTVDMLYEQGNSLGDDYDSDNTSIERALSDIEIVRSAYPDETETTAIQNHDNFQTDDHDSTADDAAEIPTFPLHVTLYLSKRQVYIVLEWNHGYPTRSPLHVSIYRDERKHCPKQRIEQTVLAVRATALECYEDGIEAGLACCSTAFETWNNYDIDDTGACDETLEAKVEPIVSSNLHSMPCLSSPQSTSKSLTSTTGSRYQWLTSNESNMIHDRKSFFLGHVCTIRSESDVKPALQELISNNNKLQRATHHMYAYRITEEKLVTESHKNGISSTKTLSILKYDSNDDGEDGAGIRLSQLLQLRNEMNVLVVVTRWFGGIHLGSKRFAHIVAAAQNVLVEYHATTTSS